MYIFRQEMELCLRFKDLGSRILFANSRLVHFTINQPGQVAESIP
jgi:hypothetical protein